MGFTHDVAIIGGGPAGAAAACALAMAGKSVAVLEKERFPRFHIGESLLPYSMDFIDRIGLRERMDRMFQPKEGAEMASACGTSRVRFWFKNGFRLKHTRAYQVERAAFDTMLLDRAAELGAEVRQACHVKSVAFDAGGATLDSPAGAVRAKYLVDASGRDTVIGNHFKLKRHYPHLKKFAVYAHYDGMRFDSEEERRTIRIVRARDRWFWVIPLGPIRTSIGMVTDLETFKKEGLPPEQALDRALDSRPVLADRLHGATRATPVRAEGEYSYRNTSLAGERWLLAGDAAGFIDPIFSTGVFLAIHSGEHAANTIARALDDPASARPGFARYERRLNKVMAMYLRFVTGWYDPAFFEVISAQKPPLQLPRAVNAVLAGNLAGGFPVWWRMQLFYLCVALHKRRPIVPRLDLEPAAA